jgi:hypothetical protein
VWTLDRQKQSLVGHCCFLLRCSFWRIYVHPLPLYHRITPNPVVHIGKGLSSRVLISSWRHMKLITVRWQHTYSHWWIILESCFWMRKLPGAWRLFFCTKLKSKSVAYSIRRWVLVYHSLSEQDLAEISSSLLTFHHDRMPDRIITVEIRRRAVQSEGSMVILVRTLHICCGRSTIQSILTGHANASQVIKKRVNF